MIALLYGWIYACLLGSLAACVVRARGYTRAPLHLRWELYPVPGTAAERAKAMVMEVLFLKGLWQFNRSLWIWSYAFHLGLYLAVCAGLAAMADALIPAAALQCALAIAGGAASILIPVGALGLLVRRLTDSKLRTYTSAGDIFNLCLFVVTVALLVGAKTFSPWVPASVFIRSLATFDTRLHVPKAQGVAFATAAALTLYIPLTHMAHSIAKYFTYHSVRWDDRPSRNNVAIEARIAEYLTYRPRWSASHIGATGGATWADVVSKTPEQEGRK